MRRGNSIQRCYSFLISIVIAILFTMFICTNSFVVKADSSASTSYDETYVMDDLSDLTIDGNKFSINDYLPDENGSLSVVVFSEYCYSCYEDMRGNFGLYVYIWNPQLTAFSANSARNTIQISFGSESDWNKYTLKFLSCSTESGYEGLFYKFKIDFSESELEYVFSVLDSEQRIYDISGIELVLLSDLTLKDYNVSATYTYTGYASGYGYTGAEGVTFTRTASDKVLEISDIRQTSWRPEGSNGSTNYTQDTLQSVYFSVPNEIFDKYGSLTRIKMEWLKAQTSWALLTGTEKFYNAFIQAVGYSWYYCSPKYTTANTIPFLDYAFATFFSPSITTTTANYEFNFPEFSSYAETISYLAYVFPTDEWGVDIADDYVVPWATIQTYMKNYYDTFNSTYTYYSGNTSYEFTPALHDYLTVDGVEYPYSEILFSSWEDEKTVADITTNAVITGNSTKELSLKSEVIESTWWDRLWGNEVSYTEDFDGIDCIKIVSDSDFDGASTEIICDSLYIDINDYDDFKDFYNTATKNDETVVLIRFDVGEYNALEVYEGTPGGTSTIPYLTDYDSNARLFNLSVYLDLDVISLTFSDGVEEVTLAVVSDPLDVGSASTGAINTTSDEDSFIDTLKKVLAVIAIVLVVVICMPLLPYIAKAIVWVVSLPFKLIKAIINMFKKRE